MVFSVFYQEDGKHTACSIWQVSSYLISMLWSAVYARARTFMWMFEHRHVCARIYANILVCMRVHRKMEYAFCPRRCRMAHTCRRPAESITVIRRSENREREERWNREQRGLTPPPDIVISSFSHHTEEEENNAQHRHLEHSLSAAQSALSANRRKRKIKEQRGEEREGRGERYRHQRR